MSGSESEASEADWVRRLQDVRRLMGWSQRRLAKELRVSAGAVSQWESRQRAIPGPVQRLIEIYEQNIGIVEGPQGPGLSKLNSSWASRTLRASTTSASIAAHLAGSSLKSLVASNLRATELKSATDQAIGQELASTLGELKGLLLKLGQMASYLRFAVPDEMRVPLQALQESTTAMSEDVVDRVFLDSMRRTPRSVFASFEARPFAAASIGQVHRGSLSDGMPVAVKVQYPRIREAIESDLSNMAPLELLSGVVLRGQQKGVLLGELRARLLEECDYVHEAKNQEDFRRCFEGVERVRIPRVFPEYSTDRILTSELMEGRSFSSFVSQADQSEKDLAGATIFRVVFESIFRHGMVNADPHPGNYLFADDGDVIFLDFGCVKRFERSFLDKWAALMDAAFDKRRQDVNEAVRALGFVPDPDKFDFDYHYRFVTELYEPWLSEVPFRFNHHFVAKTWQAGIIDNPNRTKVNLPPEFVSVSRLLWGLFSVLADLEARADWRGIVQDALRDEGSLS